MIVMKIETASDTHSTFGLAFFEVATLIAPTIVGYSLLSVKSVARYPLAIVASMVVLLAFGTNIRSIALVEAEKVKRADVNEEMVSVGTSQSTPIRDFGVVTIISKEQLEFLPGGLKIDGAYEYGPQPTAFLRLITEDDSNYFIIEKSGVKVVPVTVRKEAVIAVMFRNASVTAGQVPSTNP
jgi:hypothetical protein